MVDTPCWWKTSQSKFSCLMVSLLTMSLKPAERYEKTGTTKPAANVGLCFIQLVFLYKYTLSTSICLASAYVGYLGWEYFVEERQGGWWRKSCPNGGLHCPSGFSFNIISSTEASELCSCMIMINFSNSHRMTFYFFGYLLNHLRDENISPLLTGLFLVQCQGHNFHCKNGR